MTKSRELAFEGIDGAGKTSALQHVADTLRHEGATVCTFAPFRITNERLGKDIYPWWSNPDSARLAVNALAETLDTCRATAEHHAADFTLYDRHWMTAQCELGRIGLTSLWPDEHLIPVALLDADATVATQHLINDTDETWSGVAEQQANRERYHQLARTHFAQLHGIYRSDADVTPAQIARNIIWDLHIRR